VLSRYTKMGEKRKRNNMVTEEIVKITECPKCGSKLESPYNPKNTDASKRSESRGVNKK